MKDKKIWLLVVVFAILTPERSIAQGEIPVDMHTGQPSISIPIWQLQDYDISTPIYLQYSTAGIKQQEKGNTFGLGWNLVSGGSVTREVRGLPDDFIGTGDDQRKGWMYGTSASKTKAFYNDFTVHSVCTNSSENADLFTLDEFNYLIDTEPDIFHYDVGGISGDFVFDDSLQIRLMPWRDVRIVNSNSATGMIFTITTNNGFVYTFDAQVIMSRGIISSSIEYFRRDLELYSAGLPAVTYTVEWKLGKINSPSGAQTTFSWNGSGMLEGGITQTKIAVRNHATPINSSPTGIFDTAVADTVYEEHPDVRLGYITSSSGQMVMISYVSDGQPMSSISIRDNRKGIPNAFVKQFNFQYATYVGSGRTFLTSIAESSGCDGVPPYTFTYLGVNPADMKYDPIAADTNSVDFWGYFNGRNNTSLIPALYIYPALSGVERYRIHPIPGYAPEHYTLNGADRTANPSVIGTGIISGIRYPAGGVTTFKFEPHDFFDAQAGQDNIGGGLRIKSISYFDGMNPSTLLSKTFSYVDSTGHSSGRLITRPSFAIPTSKYVDFSHPQIIVPYDSTPGQSKWDYYTARTEQDISLGQASDGSPVIYAEVKVSRPGTGATKCQYSIPAVYGESSNGAWQATQNKFVRSINPCPEMGVVTGGSVYPYAPNPNFDHERGLVLSQTEYDSAGRKIQVTTNTYQYLYKVGKSTPGFVWGLAYDKFPNFNNGPKHVYIFGKYFLITDVDKVLLKQTVTTFDAEDSTKHVSQSTQFNYTSINHRLLTNVQQTTSDSVIHTTRTTYPLDYQSIPASNTDKALSMIKNLQTTFRNGTPIEQQSSIKRPSQAEKVVGASLIKFNDFGLSKILVDSVLGLSIASGITDFHPAAMTMSGGITWLKPDSRFELVSKFIAYDTYQRPLSVRGMSRTVSTTYWGYNKTAPVVQATNATAGQFAFSDFETTTGCEFTPSSTITGTGRTGATAMHPVVKLSKTLVKANVSNYMISFWMKKLTDPVDIKVSINSVLVATIHAAPASAGFEYFEQKIPVTSVTNGSSFLVEIQGQFTGGFNPSSDPSLLPMLDDVTFYPESAVIGSSTFAFPFGPSSTTSANKTTFMQYDGLGRTKLVRDQDQNILTRNTYTYTQPTALIANFSVANIIVSNPTLFTATPNPCVPGAVYEWDFGNGYAVGSPTINHTFNLTGKKTVRLRVTYPGYTAQISTQDITITVVTP